MPGFVDESGVNRSAIEDITINRGRPRQICGNCIYSFYKRIVEELDNEGEDYLDTGVVPFTTDKLDVYGDASGIYDIYRFFWKENFFNEQEDNLNETVVGEVYCHHQGIKYHSRAFVIIRVKCVVNGKICFIEPYGIKDKPQEMNSKSKIGL